MTIKEINTIKALAREILQEDLNSGIPLQTKPYTSPDPNYIFKSEYNSKLLDLEDQGIIESFTIGTGIYYRKI